MYSIPPQAYLTDVIVGWHLASVLYIVFLFVCFLNCIILLSSCKCWYRKKSEITTHLFKISNISAVTNLQQTVENKVKKSIYNQDNYKMKETINLLERKMKKL